MPLVHVPDIRLIAQRPQRPHPADAQHHLLRDAHLHVAAVQPGRQLPIGRRVALDIGIHQEDGDAPHLEAPHLGIDGAAGQIDADRELAPVAVERGFRRHLAEVELLVDRLLPAVGVDLLPEIALRIEEAHADEGQPQIAGLLAVISGQDAQAAGIDGQRFVQPELGREVRDRAHAHVRVRGLIPDAHGAHVRIEGIHDAGVARQVGAIGCCSRHFVLAHAAQELHRVVVHGIPQVGIDIAIQRLRDRIPAPPQIIGQLRQPLDGVGANAQPQIMSPKISQNLLGSDSFDQRLHLKPAHKADSGHCMGRCGLCPDCGLRILDRGLPGVVQ